MGLTSAPRPTSASTTPVCPLTEAHITAVPLRSASLTFAPCVSSSVIAMSSTFFASKEFSASLSVTDSDEADEFAECFCRYECPFCFVVLALVSGVSCTPWSCPLFLQRCYKRVAARLQKKAHAQSPQTAPGPKLCLNVASIHPTHHQKTG